ncbi:hypothetical protein [Saccharothrix syringae]|uniref:LppX_LprAFG lipoprotein n=1 Tax=Saccharothrix syringae TaxID=103733 RepID=A0A5Q0H7M6_SACSY|nr:hypothetical protein [Saccharothrix syringae]QFZ22189.1 hypothetical protein EKG83_36520 [Saccharothrix syringae]
MPHHTRGEYMRRALVVFALAALVAGCAQRTGLPAPTLGPALDDSAALVSVVAGRADEQRSVRFDSENAMGGLRVELNGDLLRAREGRLVALSDATTDVVVLADAGWSRTSGGAWTRHDLADRAPVRADTTVAGLPDEVDPAAVVRSLEGGLVVEKAEEELDGAPTRRYTMLVNLRQQAERTRDTTRRAQLLAADESGFTAIATVWVGAGDLPVRVEQVLRTQEETVFQRVEHRFTDWNADIRIGTPTP